MTESDLKKALGCARHIQFLLTKMDGSKTVSVEEELIANGIISLHEKCESLEKDVEAWKERTVINGKAGWRWQEKCDAQEKLLNEAEKLIQDNDCTDEIGDPREGFAEWLTKRRGGK